MKRTILALAAAALVSAGASAQQQNVSIVENQNYIEVNGYSLGEVSPDRIFIRFQIAESDSRGRESVAAQERAMVQALQRIGIDTEEQLTINDMSSNFQKYILRRTDIQQSRDYVLEVPSAATAASAFAALEGAGISNAAIDRAEYRDIDAFTLANKVKAVQNAREKATALAAAVGQTIGRAIFIQDFERTYRAFSTGMMVKSAVAMDAAATAEAAPNIDFQKITVESNVTVRFLLE